MFSLSAATRVFLLPGATDMRKSFNGLFALAQHQLNQDPQSGHLFVFCNRHRNRLKILCWDGSGLWILAKRLETGRFSWPGKTEDSVEYTSGQLTLLLNGIELNQTRSKRWYRN